MAINLSIGSKVAIGLIGASAVATGGYLANEYLIGTKITELLEKDELTLLKKEDNEKAQWGKRWKEYVAQGNNKWEISDYNENKEKFEDAPNSFKDACIYRSSKRINSTEDSVYADISKYCTKGFPISELIKKDQTRQLISEKTEPSEANKKWEAVWKEYFKTAKEENPLGLDLKKPEPATEAKVPEDYEKQCKAKEKDEVRNNKDKAYEVVKTWCTESR